MTAQWLTEDIAPLPLSWATARTSSIGGVDGFYEVIAEWFDERFANGPTEPQARAWPEIQAGHDVLVAAPTGSGKTLTGFLVGINRLLTEPSNGAGPSVLYVSPLRALAADIEENLSGPLAQITERCAEAGHPIGSLRIGVRTGDTTASQRAAMRKHPPDLLVTTPESLYLLLSSPNSRAMLRDVRTVIVDEVHTIARDKRGAHLALSLERLTSLVREANGRAIQRIGLSATQRPLEVVGRLLVGAARELPVIIDCGHARRMDVSISVPQGELEAVISTSQFGEVLDAIADEVRAHRTTLVFVNTRKMAERVAHQLAERFDDEGLGESVVSAHHGSLSPERRKSTEAKLRNGELRALVATASLELGIDVGPVEAVCQLGSPRSIGTFLQRVGRANHSRDGVPRGVLYPLTRDELVECVALLRAIKRGHLDALHPVRAPLDILAQHLVAQVAVSGEEAISDLYDLVRRSAPYSDLERSEFDEVVDLVCEGIVTGRGARGAHLHRDGVHGLLRPRRGARLAAVTGGGAIPETGDYKVVLDPEGVTVGSVHEDFAVEANVGDIFLLGTHSWRVAKVEVGVVRVHDAGDMAPTVPFWLGEAPARSEELSAEVGQLRALLNEPLSNGEFDHARRLVRDEAGVDDEVAHGVVAYLHSALESLGTLPTDTHLVIERFFDEVESQQLVVHSPLGGRINRALGLALRKRFCVSFDFELQAAADDDTVLISLGPQHSFTLESVPKMLHRNTVESVLTQAVLRHPMLIARWRWNATRALVIPRARGGRRRPIHLQRMESDDLLAAAWPALAACQENIGAGPVPIPEHVLVRQSVADCLVEPLDLAGLDELLRRIDTGEVSVSFVDSPEPSVLAHGILTGKPFTFLDDAPAEERRSRAVGIGRGLGLAGGAGEVPLDALAPLDPGVVAKVLASCAPELRNDDELHDLMVGLVAMRAVPTWQGLFDSLRRNGRAHEDQGVWVATERLEMARSLADDDHAATACVRGHLDLAGPVSVEDLIGLGAIGAGPVRGAPIAESRAHSALGALEAMGHAFVLPDGRYCARHLLARLHGASRSHRRALVEAVSIETYMNFLAHFQHVAPDTQCEGRDGLLEVLDQLAGLELAAGAWEREVLSARIKDYDPRWLDELCLAGEVGWARLSVKSASTGDRTVSRRSGAPSRATPLAFMLRADSNWHLAAVRVDGPPGLPAAGAAADIEEVLRVHGASFRADLPELSRRLPAEVDDGLWELVARGLVSADGFSALRSLLSARARWRTRQRPTSVDRAVKRLRRTPPGSGSGEGRWALIETPSTDRFEPDVLAEAIATQWLRRWGIVTYELWSKEPYRISYREVLRALRRFEARGLCLGGRFVAGLSGEQFALPAAKALLDDLSRSALAVPISLSASDPLNLTGIVVPGARVPAVAHRSVVIGARASVILEGA